MTNEQSSAGRNPSSGAPGAPAASRQRTFRGRTADERRAERREALVQATLDLISEGGWSSATMTAICRRAGLTERYFYESFKNRDALFINLVQRTIARIELAVSEAIQRPDATPTQRIRSIVDAVLDALLADPRLGRVALLEGVEQPEVHRVRRDAIDRFEGLLQQSASVLLGYDPGGSDGAVMAVASLVGAAQELLTRRLNGTLGVSDEQLAAHLVALATEWPRVSPGAG